VVDRVMGAVITGAALLVGISVISVVVYIVLRGRHVLPHWNFFSQSSNEGPTAPYSQGGIWNAVVGTFIQVGLAIVISLPLGVGTAVFMTEVGGWFARFVRTVVEAMTALPDLLAGLFVFVTLVLVVHMRPDGFCVSVALAVTMTPIIARSAEVALRVVPGGLREASLALGASQWATVRRVVLATARPGLATALILSVARAIGESAPLLIVSGNSTIFNTNPVDNKPMNSLPLYIFESVRSGQPREIARGFGAAIVLLAIVFLLFLVTRIVARHRVGAR
jgi:phosphate transport system permease protein